MTTRPNEPTAIIEGHSVDHDALARYLRETLKLEGPLEVKEFGGGFSNFTYLLKVGSTELVMRRGPKGVKVVGARDMSREYRTLVGLAPMWSRSPKPIAYCDDLSVLDAPFYVMERVQGVVIRKDSVDLSAEIYQRPSTSLCDTLVEYHLIDFVRAGLGELGKPEGFVERQVSGWTKRFYAAKTEEAPRVDALAAWLAANIPKSQRVTLLHNDYKYDNVLVDSGLTHVVCLLDWEMATLGDPLVDLGASLALWVDPEDPPAMNAARFGPTNMPGNLSRLEFAERYAKAMNLRLDHLGWYYVLGLFKMLVALQQLWQRYALGKTTESRYLVMPEAVKAMTSQAHAVIKHGRIDRLEE